IWYGRLFPDFGKPFVPFACWQPADEMILTDWADPGHAKGRARLIHVALGLGNQEAVGNSAALFKGWALFLAGLGNKTAPSVVLSRGGTKAGRDAVASNRRARTL